MKNNLIRLNAVVIIDEWTFFHPELLERVFHLFDRVVKIKVLIVKKVPRKSNIRLNFLWYLVYIGPFEMCKLFYRFVCAKFLLKRCDDCGLLRSVRSVASVARKLQLESEIVNSAEEVEDFFNNLQSEEYDVLISSNSLYIREEWLQNFRLGGVNRHSSLLPAYGGLWPILHGLINHEWQYGVSVHKITSKIDKGEILAQVGFERRREDTVFTLYQRAFDLSPEMIRLGLENLENESKPVSTVTTASYFSKLTRAEWSKLRKTGVRFV